MKLIYFATLFLSCALQIGLFAQSTQSNGNAQKAIQDPYAPPPADELRSNQKVERTLSILKPDALKNRHIGDIISRFEDAGMHVAALKMIKLTPEQAGQFYSAHRDRPFYAELVKYMSSGPIVVMVLEGDQAISRNRQMMGATNPLNATPGSIRADYAESTTKNAVHGSDSPESARQEIAFFFKPDEIYAGY
jgi:nucleoside-diphosphate kinase